MLDKITKGGYIAIRIVTGILAAVFLVYSLFTLWDMYRTEIRAFASYDLLKYRPDIEHDEPPYLDELLEINPDTAGWVTIYGTNIDYPVMKGKNDMEYLNKTATGTYAVTGSVFMSMLNSKDFSDPYTLIYGHHMANGSMFGDIDKFKDKDFFFNVKEKRFKTDEGVLIMENIVYNLKVFAIIETNAYDDNIYHSDKTQNDLTGLLSYLKTNSMYYIEKDNIDKILALSTCDNANTDGRTILLCQMKLRTEPLPTREEEPLTPHRKAVGHPMAGAYWALLNLIIMLLTIYTAIPVHLYKDLADEWKHERKKLCICAGTAIVSAFCFLLTEDPHKPIQTVDMWTPIMLMLFAAVWLYRAGYIQKLFISKKKSLGSQLPTA